MQNKFIHTRNPQSTHKTPKIGEKSLILQIKQLHLKSEVKRKNIFLEENSK